MAHVHAMQIRRVPWTLERSIWEMRMSTPQYKSTVWSYSFSYFNRRFARDYNYRNFYAAETMWQPVAARTHVAARGCDKQVILGDVDFCLAMQTAKSIFGLQALLRAVCTEFP